jgi:3-methylfumaryl-CoA hydratase
MGANSSTGPAVTDEARALIGSVTATYRSDPVSMRQIREYVAATGGRPELVGVDTPPDEPICAPPLFFHAACRPVVAQDELLSDGQYSFLGVPGVSGHVRVGDVLTVTERLQRIAEKQGTKGPLVFVTTESRYHNQAGELVARYEQTVIFR